ncbi:MAG: adenosylcobinamide-phosphate synthase CbiB, partial [Longimicrobiales bacterium]
LAVKPTFAIRALLDAGAAVRSALLDGDLAAARAQLGTHLVSRPVHDLAADEIAAATIESLAENLTDSVVGPLFAAAIAGPGAAWAYRFVNTADAVLGYRTLELRDIGAAPARVDDMLNFVPARIGAMLIGIAAPAGRGNAARALRTASSDHARTASPNAGWTMAAMAGALDISLSKRGAYTLNPCGRAADAADIARASRIVLAASGLALVLSTLLAAVISSHRRAT